MFVLAVSQVIYGEGGRPEAAVAWYVPAVFFAVIVVVPCLIALLVDYRDRITSERRERP